MKSRKADRAPVGFGLPTRWAYLFGVLGYALAVMFALIATMGGAIRL